MVKVYTRGYCWREAKAAQDGVWARRTVDWVDTLAANVKPIEERARGLTDRLVSAVQAGRLVVVTGAGLGISCGYPSWEELLRSVYLDVMRHNDIRDDRVDVIYRSLRFRDDATGFPEALLAIGADSDLRGHVTRALASYTTKRSELLRRVAHIVAEVFRINRRANRLTHVITFNYDRLLEEELQRLRVPVRTVTVAEFTTGPTDVVSVVHAHGYIDSSHDVGHITLTESSYGQVYFGGTDPLSAAIDTSSELLFIGFSFRDIFVRRVLHECRTRVQRPVGATITPTDAFVDVAILKEGIKRGSMMDYDPEELIGWQQVGKDPTTVVSDALHKLPSQLVRWLLHSIGIEWLEVTDFNAIAHAVSDLASSATGKRRNSNAG